MSRFKPFDTDPVPERALLVGVEYGRREWSLEDSMAELARLAETDGAEVVATLTQRLDTPVSKTFIGKGKAEELVSFVRNLNIDVVIFDDELSPSQQSNLEKIVGSPTKIIDRTALILDIFGTHAKTREGRLQVQLAQLQYVLPRLRGMWSHLVGEQTRGGIGSRFGQGESQLEIDRRLIRDKISMLQHELRNLEKRREVQSKLRWDSGIFSVSLAGYTNAGKSTLLNQLTNASVYAKDELFATLDPTTRTITLEEGRKITLTDTVGFIQKLPTTLIESFKSTLAEAQAADLILLVVDASDKNFDKEIEVVTSILDDIKVSARKKLLVFNKIDLLDANDLAKMRTLYPDAAFISAQKAMGLRGLLYTIAHIAGEDDKTLHVCIPFDQGFLIHMVHERCQIIRTCYQASGLQMTVRADKQMQATLSPFTCS